MNCSKMAALWLIGGLTLKAGSCFGQGLVIIPGADGTVQFQEQSNSFSRHYGPGGRPIIPEAERSASQPQDSMALLAEPENGFAAPRAVRGTPEIINEIDRTALRYAGHNALRKAGISVSEWQSLYRANIEIESAYNPRARSHVGAIGLGQLMPATAAKLGVNPHDIQQNLDGSARFLLLMLDQFGTKELALAAYNAGPGAVSRHGGIPPFRETQGHVRKVMAVYHRLTGEQL